MKHLALITLIVAIVGLAGCGGDASSGDSGDAKAAKLTKPNVKPHPGPPPTELVIRDLQEGSGPEAKRGDTVTYHYVGDDKTGKQLYSSWDRGFGPLTMEIGDNSYDFQGLDEGLEGMQAGGRRELLIPAKLAFGEPLFYVIDLLNVEQPRS